LACTSASRTANIAASTPAPAARAWPAFRLSAAFYSVTAVRSPL